MLGDLFIMCLLAFQCRSYFWTSYDKIEDQQKETEEIEDIIIWTTKCKLTLAWCSNRTFTASGCPWPAAQINGVPASLCESTSTPLESKIFSNLISPVRMHKV